MTNIDNKINKKNNTKSKIKKIKQMKQVKRKIRGKKIESYSLKSIYNKLESKKNDAIRKRKTIKKNKNIFLNKKKTYKKKKTDNLIGSGILDTIFGSKLKKLTRSYNSKCNKIRDHLG